MAVPAIDESTGFEEIERALQNLHLQSGDTTQAVSVLAEASKTKPATREQLADPKTLKLLVEIVETSLNESLETTDLALRCIGNASIENNDARETLTDLGFSWALHCLQLSSLQDLKTQLLTVKVLYNICCDYEPAQKQCFNERVHDELIHLSARDEVVNSDDRTLLLELLFWICSPKDADSTAANPISDQTLDELFQLPRIYYDALHPEDWGILLEICLMNLRDTEVQKRIISLGQSSRILDMLELNEDKLAEVEAEEDHKLLVPLTTSITWCLSDMAALPEFSQTYGLDSDLVQKVVKMFKDASNHIEFRIAVACCQVLGNLLWAQEDPSMFGYWIERETLHYVGLQMVVSCQDPEVMHAGAGLLIQLSRAPSGRKYIGGSGNAHMALSMLCHNETPQLKQDGIKLLKSLGRDSRENQDRFADLAADVMKAASAENTNMVEDSS